MRHAHGSVLTRERPSFSLNYYQGASLLLSWTQGKRRTCFKPKSKSLIWERAGHREWQTGLEQKSMFFPSPPSLCALCARSPHVKQRLLHCCDNLFTVYVRPATENAARGLRAETAGSLTSLSGPGRYPDRKQLDAPLNTTLKNTWAENAKSSDRRTEGASGKSNDGLFHDEETHANISRIITIITHFYFDLEKIINSNMFCCQVAFLNIHLIWDVLCFVINTHEKWKQLNTEVVGWSELHGAGRNSDVQTDFYISVQALQTTHVIDKKSFP